MVFTINKPSVTVKIVAATNVNAYIADGLYFANGAVLAAGMSTDLIAQKVVLQPIADIKIVKG